MIKQLYQNAKLWPENNKLNDRLHQALNKN